MKPTREKQGTEPFLLPDQNQDFYSLEHLFLTPFREEEEWNFSQVPFLNLSFLSFLTLRSFLYFDKMGKPLFISHLSLPWRAYLGKTGYFQYNPYVVALDFVPSLEVPQTSSQKRWKYELEWQQKTGKSPSFFICNAFALGNSSPLIADVLSEQLKTVQTEFHVTRAFVRKETTSYLYLQSETKANPRIFLREETVELPGDFMLLFFELKPRSATLSG